MKIYNIYFKKLIFLLLPTFLRKERIVSFIQSLLAPLNRLYKEFIAFRNDILDELNYNSQVCRLRGLLNDKFDRLYREIWINDMKRYGPLIIYKHIEKKPVMIAKNALGKPKMIYRTHLRFTDKGFIVHVPSDILNLKEKEEKIRAYLDKYKLVTTVYKLEEEKRKGKSNSK